MTKKIFLPIAAASILAGVCAQFTHADAPVFAPDNFTATSISSTEIDLSWAYVNASLVSPSITGYMIERESPVGGGFTTIVANTASMSYNDTNLTPNQTYNYRLTALNADGSSPTRTASVSTAPVAAPLSPPDPPQNMTAAGASGYSINLSWSAAPNSPTINGYRVERTNGGGYTTIASSTSGTSYTDSNLSPNSNVGYRVIALSDYGESNPSLTAYGTTFTLPGQPQSASAVAGNGQATVSWTLPYFTGGEITGYLIQSMPSTSSTLAAASPLSQTITGLKNGVSYTFMVTPVNSLGYGTPATTNSVIPSAAPVPPPAPTTTPTPTPPPVDSTPHPPAPPADMAALQLQLNALLAQVQALMQKAAVQQQAASSESSSTNASIGASANPSAPVTTSSSATGFTRNLYFGIRGSDVADLQNFLIAKNKGPEAAALAAVSSRGYFGALTQKALAEYQANVGISPASGYFGPLTRAQVSSGR